MQRAAIARGEQSLGGLVAAVDGTEAVNNVAIWKIICTGDHRLTRADPCQRPALRLKARSGRSMDCSGHAAAGAQLRIRGIHDCFHIRLVGDVALNAFDSDAVVFSLRHEDSCALGHAASVLDAAAPLTARGSSLAATGVVVGSGTNVACSSDGNAARRRWR